jgi:uncharacterized protein YkwD
MCYIMKRPNIQNLIVASLILGGALFWTVVIAYAVIHDKKQAQAAAAPQVCAVDAGQLLTEINAERSRLGAPQLTIEPLLATSSRAKLDEMVASKYFGHNRLDGSSWSTLVDSKVRVVNTSEDIEYGNTTPADQWDHFKNSPAHYKSLTDPQYTRVGIASSCEDFNIEQVTGPSDNTKDLHNHVISLTVVHLADPEPVKAPETRVETRYIQQQTVPTYTQPKLTPDYSTTNCYNTAGGYGVTCNTTSY